MGWRSGMVSLCMVLGWGLPLCVQADLVTSFEGLTLDPNLYLDVPDPDIGTIELDTVNHNLRFTGPGADLWDWRNGLPYAWTDIPQVGVGGVWRAETEVQYYDTSERGRIVGLTTYAGPDGAGGAAMGQEFTFGLDHWDWPNGVWVQGLGDNQPGDSGNLANELITDLVDLRMDVTVGDLNFNTYDFYYKQWDDVDWTGLGTISYVNEDKRVALFFKGNEMNVSFNYFNVTAVPEPGSIAMVGIGALSLWLVRLRKPARA